MCPIDGGGIILGPMHPPLNRGPQDGPHCTFELHDIELPQFVKLLLVLELALTLVEQFICPHLGILFAAEVDILQLLGLGPQEFGLGPQLIIVEFWVMGDPIGPL